MPAKEEEDTKQKLARREHNHHISLYIECSTALAKEDKGKKLRRAKFPKRIRQKDMRKVGLRCSQKRGRREAERVLALCWVP
jgi:hypothetical protein